MKSLIRTLLVCLISSQTFACGWYPFGEDVRFSLMSPSAFDDGGMSPYYYTWWNYGYSFTSTPENDPNIALWKDYCNGKVDEQSIYEAVYELRKYQLENRKSRNRMVQYLIANDQEALNYIAFAKSCSRLNNGPSEWELDNESDSERRRMMLKALNKGNEAKSESIKKRYRFLALRLAFYDNDQEKVNRIFKTSFSNEPSDAIDYWALYFNAAMEEKSAERNFHLTQVFVNAPGKRFGVLTNMTSAIPIDEVLKYAKTDVECANVHVVYAVRNRGRGLSTLKTVQQLDSQNPLLDYLLVREINKIEDWVLTPHYTNFDPSMDPRGGRYELSNKLVEERIKDDEMYCLEISQWISSLKLSPEKTTWTIAEAYLSGISGKNSFAYGLLEGVKSDNAEVEDLVNQLKLLFKVRSNADKSLLKEEEAFLMNRRQQNYNLFLFAVSREYEFQDKLDIAAALFSHVNKRDDFYDSGVTWRSETGKATLTDDFFYSWFFYLDAEYTPEQVQTVIDFTELKFAESTEFDHWQREHLQESVDQLYDLLGTKYVRQNKTEAAITAFENVGGDLWDKYPYANYLNANPFHADFYSGHKPSKLDTIRYTKLELVKQYKEYADKAQNPQTENRAYYYFLLGNCELNMSHYGNSWMMRRYFWTGAMRPNFLEDDDEFYRLNRAQEFYQAAYDLTTSSEVKALCLRMKGRCEKHALLFDAPYSWDFDYDEHGGFNKYIFSKNTSYNKLQKDYPDDANDLMSNCFSFERYFAKLEN
ncbi:MAG: hypothetical protein P8P74_03765 [Crocinitomicaceae bacterium]|nr:hypothetical protein [Crocinitomicaceae bacterium]